MIKSMYKEGKTSTKQRVEKKALVTFLDDDGNAEVYSKLYPIFKEKNVPFSACLITGLLDNPGKMTSKQVRKLISEGHEMLGHSHDAHHNNMTDYSLEYLESDTLKCLKALQKLGSNSRGFVYPQTRSNIHIRRIVRKNFDFAFGALGVNKDKNVEVMKLKRLGFGMWGSGNNLEVYKTQIDYLVRKGGWLTYMVHTGVGPTAQEELALMPELIDYIQSKGIDIVNASEGYALYGSGKDKPILQKGLELVAETMSLTLHKKRRLLKTYINILRAS